MGVGVPATPRSAPTPSSLPWVHGLRQEPAGDWRPAIADLILARFNGIRRQSTMEAEAGLGIPASWYCYVGRTERVFGHAVGFFHAAAEGWEPGSRGVCPFDSGGLWHNRVKTAPPLDDPGKRALFARCDRLLAAWTDTVVAAVQAAYPSFRSYILGHRPRTGIAEILEHPDNTSPSWTWEARIARSDGARYVRIERLYCTDEDRSAFLDWLPYSPLGIDEAKRAATWLDANVTTCPPTESPSRRAETDLLERHS